MQQILYTLLNFINNTIYKDTSYHIALIILKNLKRLPSISLEKAAEICDVSISTLNRFCKNMGFGSFSGLKELSKIPDLSRYEDENLDVDNHLIFKQVAIFKALEDVNHMDEEIFKTTVRLLYNANNVVFVGYGKFQNSALKLQTDLMEYDKFSLVKIDLNGQISELKYLNEDDLVIIVSLGGTIFKYKNIVSALNNCKAEKILITEMENHEIMKICKQVIRLGKDHKFNSKRYQLVYFYELLALHYQKYYELFKK